MRILRSRAPAPRISSSGPKLAERADNFDGPFRGVVISKELALRDIKLRVQDTKQLRALKVYNTAVKGAATSFGGGIVASIWLGTPAFALGTIVALAFVQVGRILFNR